jgi:hypothetical protein
VFAADVLDGRYDALGRKFCAVTSQVLQVGLCILAVEIRAAVCGFRELHRRKAAHCAE